MNEGEKRRQKIFEKYRDNLNFLIDSGFIKSDRNLYICPLCLKPHSNMTSDDPLTLEDAPPKSLGGKANILTCKSCNNTSGHKIDFHLTERLNELDNSKFLPNTERKIQVKIGEETLQATLKVEADGTLKIFHSKKNNNPIKLADKMDDLQPGKVVDMNFIKSRVIPENLGYALLKSAYLLAFEMLGYSIILDDCFKPIRQQLKNPETQIYPSGFWFTPPFPKELSGVYFVCDKGFECLLVLFNVKTEHTERMFGVLLPLPKVSIKNVIEKLSKRFETEKEFTLELYPFHQKKLDYLFDEKNISYMFKWLSKL